MIGPTGAVRVMMATRLRQGAQTCRPKIPTQWYWN
jgi:hypothetical protein